MATSPTSGSQSAAPVSVGTVRDAMEEPVGLFPPLTTVKEAIAALRELVKSNFITYLFVVDIEQRLLGVVAMRELLLAEPAATLESVMVPRPFALTAEMPILYAMKASATKHFPVYPVVSESGALIGLVRGHRLFEAQAFEISAQAGSMVGVEKEERLWTSWTRSFRLRQPWLQLNLLTAFLAGAVVNTFQSTIDQLVILAAFLPVLAGQSGNTGCQALAVTLRGMTLGDLRGGMERLLVKKEALLGLCNGLCVGISAAAGMYFLATTQSNPDALLLSGVVLLAMTVSCVVSGVSGALVPLTLKRLGMDPATASSIFLTTATDVVSMGTLLMLATFWVL